MNANFKSDKLCTIYNASQYNWEHFQTKNDQKKEQSSPKINGSIMNIQI